MAGRVENKIAIVTGAARGQGRSHALRLAEEGADIVALDVCADIPTVPYAGATEADLAETVKLVEHLGRRVIGRVVDIRDSAGLEDAAAACLSKFGRIDILSANAGIFQFGKSWEIDDHTWQTMIDVNLTGAWRSAKAVIPQMIEQRSGSIIFTSSGSGQQMAQPNAAHYVSAKHGVTGLMRALAIELAPYSIRCNSVHTTTVSTPMVHNQAVYSLFMGGKPDATLEEALIGFRSLNALPIPWVESVDVSNLVLFLASEESRYVTGGTHRVDAGWNTK